MMDISLAEMNKVLGKIYVKTWRLLPKCQNPWESHCKCDFPGSILGETMRFKNARRAAGLPLTKEEISL